MFKNSSNRNDLQYVSLGAELAIALSVPLLIGYWLDLKWGSSPWMLLTGVLLGLVIMIRIFMKVIRNMNEK